MWNVQIRNSLFLTEAIILKSKSVNRKMLQFSPGRRAWGGAIVWGQKTSFNYFGSSLVFASRSLIHFFSSTIRLCSFVAPDTLKSKSLVNCCFIFWNTGSWAVIWARLARDSLAAVENCWLTAETFSIPIPNVLTSFFTKFRVCGVIVASLTETIQEGHVQQLARQEIESNNIPTYVTIKCGCW